MNMTARTKGIGHLAARSLLEEIAGLRDDIHAMSGAIAEVESLLGVLFMELRNIDRSRRPRPMPVDAE